MMYLLMQYSMYHTRIAAGEQLALTRQLSTPAHLELVASSRACEMAARLAAVACAAVGINRYGRRFRGFT